MLSVQQHYQIAKAHRFIGTPLSTIRGNVIVQNEHSNDSNSSSCNDSVKDNRMSSAQKRKLYGSTLPQQQSSVARRNARERNRVKQVNNGFATLRQHIPDALATFYASSANPGGNNADGNGSGSSSASGSKSNSKKLSKVEILRIALKYIEGMKSMIDEHDAEAMSQTSSSASPLPNNIVQTLDSAGMTVDMNFELKSESDEESYPNVQTHYDQQYVHQDQYQMIQQQPQLQQQVQQQQQVTYVNSNSPTPSYTSETSSTGGSQGYGQGSYHTMNSLNLQTQVSFDSAPFMSSEEKDILHFINQWQNDNQHHQQQQQQQLLHA
ncbi:achaete-scute complex protein T3-like [Trichogramma pretiosum]|uniref:achaete-scute complex protein T3-like n=1 Tax=Trichogramma pretiosum TaxID=7493 RepID=UPI0006C94839|nr:achaete-scute complex protein T3-like [Trichogramma pretiosum]